MTGITSSADSTMRQPFQPTAAADVFADELDAVRRRQPVSYTHLTLPTILRV